MQTVRPKLTEVSQHTQFVAGRASWQQEQDISRFERYNDSVDCTNINLKDFDVYQIESELQNDLFNRQQRHDIRLQLADYIDSHTSSDYFLNSLYSDVVHRLFHARKKGALGICPSSLRRVTAWDTKVNCVRLCPDEAREETQRLTRKYAPHIFRLLENNPSYRLFYAVYTEPNIDINSLKSGKQNQFKRFSNMHRSKWAKSCIKGSFVIQEDPLAINEDGWNVHLNAIHVVEGDFSFKRLRQEWGYNVEIKQIKGTPEHIAKAFLEVVKYSAKHIGEKAADGKHDKSLGITSWKFEHFHHWFMSGKGFRRSRSYGCLYRPDTIPDKGIDMSEVLWIGSIEDINGSYRMHLKRDFEEAFKVDLIMADKFAERSPNSPQFLNSSTFSPPN